MPLSANGLLICWWNCGTLKIQEACPYLEVGAWKSLGPESVTQKEALGRNTSTTVRQTRPEL